MADGNVQPSTAATVAPAFLGNTPAPFLQSPDSDKDNWNVWLLAWNNYLSVVTALSPGQLTDAVKNAMLLNALGTEGFRKSTADPILSSPTTASYTDFQSAATRLLSVKGSEIRASWTFSAAVNVLMRLSVVF